MNPKHNPRCEYPLSALKKIQEKPDMLNSYLPEAFHAEGYLKTVATIL
jgi:hypothetical protein